MLQKSLEFTHEANLDLRSAPELWVSRVFVCITAEIGTANERAWPTAGHHACAIVPVVADCCGRKLFLMIANEVIDTTAGQLDFVSTWVRFKIRGACRLCLSRARN